MALFKCKMCGGNIEFKPGDTVGTCDSCGSTQTLPKVNDDVITNLFNRANNLRLKAEFDKASAIYEKIVNEDNANAEAHWGIVLCKYGIEYVEDPATYKRVPTCHRTQYESIMTDVDYIAALENCDTTQQSIYTQQALEISNIQKGILAIVKEEKPFDVFICYKETDENGKRTVDSVLANDIYYQLTQEGLKVFYAAITLEDKLGQEYEPYIFAALNSAKVMLVVGTKPEYFEAVWVRNEWSRFMKIMKNDRSKLLIPCYRDMDAYDLPEDFSHLQAQDMSKIGFVNDVVRGIKKVIDGSQPKSQVVNETTVINNAVSANTDALLKRAFMFLEDGKWQDADEYCEKVLDQNPECAEAYLGKLMAELGVERCEELADCDEPFDDSYNYEKVLRFGDEKIKKELQGYITHINDRNETARLTRIYNNALNAMSSANTEETFKAVAFAFESVSGFKDSDEKAKECLEKAKECFEKAEAARKDAIYNSAKSKMAGEKSASYEEAVKAFQSIPGWKDADEQIYICQRKIEEIKTREESYRLEYEKVNTQVESYNDSIKQIQLQIDNEKKALSSLGLLAFSNKKAIQNNISVLSDKLATEETNKNIYISKLSIKRQMMVNTDTLFFGMYPQNAVGKETTPIQWRVLAREDNRVLVISEYAIDCQQYNTGYEDITWETSTIRKWLNNDFLNEAFSAEEQAKIQSTTVTADANPEYSTDPGNDTTDKVFLLSITEAEEYFTSDSARQCKPTKHAVTNGAYVNSDNCNCWWWLRSPGGYSDYAAYVFIDGSLDYCGGGAHRTFGVVRPALWISLDF